MGIRGLWDILGEGQVTSIAQLATEHFQQTKRPLRIAVDEAGWRFNNLTDDQVRIIRQREPAANPIEKAILFKILRLLKLNIQLIFVFDGPHRPWKRGGAAGRVDYNKIELLRQLLDTLRIPHHRAPAEAEAECARLQQLGVVDAVWSDDGDTLMFGCDFLIKDHRDEKKKKSDTHVRVYRSETVLEQHGLDRQGLVAFAMLSGADYDLKGVDGCGPQLALQAAQFGFGAALCECHEKELPEWRDLLVEYFRGKAAIIVPPGFPSYKVLKKYNDPRVSSPQELLDIRGLRRGWDVPIEEEKLRVLLRQKFNFWTRGYMRHIAPVLLARKLAKVPPDHPVASNVFDLALLPAKKGKDDQASGLRKVTFPPSVATVIDVTVQPEDEDWSVFISKDGVLYDPQQKIEGEFLECLLRRVIPESAFDAPRNQDAKRIGKRPSNTDEYEGNTAGRAPKRQQTTRTYKADLADMDSRTNFISSKATAAHSFNASAVMERENVHPGLSFSSTTSNCSIPHNSNPHGYYRIDQKGMTESKTKRDRTESIFTSLPPNVQGGAMKRKIEIVDLTDI